MNVTFHRKYSKQRILGNVFEEKQERDLVTASKYQKRPGVLPSGRKGGTMILSKGEETPPAYAHGGVPEHAGRGALKTGRTSRPVKKMSRDIR